MRPTRRSFLLASAAAPFVPWPHLDREPPKPSAGASRWTRSSIEVRPGDKRIQLGDSFVLNAGDYVLVARTGEVLPVEWYHDGVGALHLSPREPILKDDWICRLYQRGDA